MADMAVGQVVQVTVVGRYLGQTTMNTYPHVVTAIAGGPVTMTAGLTALNTAIAAVDKLYNKQRKCCPQNWVHVESWLQVVFPTRLRKLSFAIDLPGVFTEFDGLTPNLQASIERFSEEAGRREQGAVRIPIGTDNTCIEDGSITPGLKTELALLAVQMAATTVAGGVTYVPVVGLGSPPSASLKVFGTNVKDTVRVIRRRTLGLGI